MFPSHLCSHYFPLVCSLIGAASYRLSTAMDYEHMLEGRQMSVIKWWTQPTQRQTFPALSQLAVEVLSAFAMSTETERTFSKDFVGAISAYC
jgi:hypothetical protein